MLCWPVGRPPLGQPFTLNTACCQAVGLEGWWPVARDPWRGRIKGRDLTYAGSVTMTPADTVGASQTFGGADTDYASVPSLGISGAGARTWVAWVNPSSAKTTLQAFFFMGAGTTRTNFGIYTDVVTGNDVYVHFHSSDVYSGAVLTPDTWQHLAVVFQGGLISATSVTAYVNGAAKSMTLTGDLAAADTTDTNRAFGNDLITAGRGYQGQIADARLYSRALSAAEVFALYAPQTRWQLYGTPVARARASAVALRWPVVGPGIVGGSPVVGVAA